MATKDPSPHLSQEPQSARGAPGSRGIGEPVGADASDRPAGRAHKESTSINQQGTLIPSMIHLPPA